MPKPVYANLSGDVNNAPTINAQRVNTQSYIDIGNNIEYDVKSYQVKKTIVKCTRVKQKLLKLKRS